MKRKIWLLLFFILMSGCSNLKRYVPLPTPTPTEGALRLTATPTVLPSPTPFEGRAVAQGQNATRRAVVCTGWVQGALNVRACPGVQCWAFFVLAEGREVTVNGTSQAEDGATWAHVVQPVDGWVNGKYLCEVKP